MNLPLSERPEDYLFITEVGSRMWEMADISSDHDLFFCYQTPASKYLRTGNFIPTRPQHHYVTSVGTEFDCQFMEIGHLVKLLMKGNVNAIWAVCSGIVHKDSEALKQLKHITLNNLSKDSYPSIKGMAISQFRDAEKRVVVKPREKSLMTCLRTINFGVELLEGRGCKFAPINADTTVTEAMCNWTFEYLDELLEKSTIRESPDHSQFLDYLLARRCEELESHIKARLKL